MVLDVVVVVRVPGVAEQRLEDVREREVEDGKAFGEYAVIVDVVVQHQREGSSAPEGEGNMEGCVQVGEMPVQQNRAGQVHAAIHQDIGQEDDVGRMSDDLHSEARIWPHEVAVEHLRDVFVVPLGEDLCGDG